MHVNDTCPESIEWKTRLYAINLSNRTALLHRCLLYYKVSPGVIVIYLKQCSLSRMTVLVFTRNLNEEDMGDGKLLKWGRSQFRTKQNKLGTE